MDEFIGIFAQILIFGANRFVLFQESVSKMISKKGDSMRQIVAQLSVRLKITHTHKRSTYVMDRVMPKPNTCFSLGESHGLRHQNVSN